MTPISNSGYGGFNFAELQKAARQAFVDADADESGSISKTEATQAAQDSGLPDSALNKMFSQMDSDGDGEISAQEKSDAYERMQERMASMQGSPSISGQTESASLFESLLQSLSDDQEEEDEELDDLIAKLKEDPQSDELNREAANVIDQRIPVIDTTA